MSGFPAGTRLRMLARSLIIQGSWNYETLIGAGFAYTLLPALRRVHRTDPEALNAAVARHADVFNSHPYLVTVAAGAVARLEAERADPAVLQRFKNALRGSLGSLGDRLVWSAWRPASLLLGLALFLAGAAWWAAVSAFLIVYNALHLALRTWGLSIGLRGGLEVGKTLRAAPLQALIDRTNDAGAFLCGLSVLLFVDPSGVDPLRAAVGVGGAGLGLWLGLRTRLLAGAWTGSIWVLVLILGLII